MKVRNRNTTKNIEQDALPQQVDTSRLPGAQPGYYPGFSTLSQQAFWDEATRNVVLARVEQVPPIRYFSAEEAQLMQAVCDRLLPRMIATKPIKFRL